MATRLNVHQLGDTAVNISVTVADQTARFALTTTQVQKGDFVVQADTGQWYLIIDDSKLNEAGGYQSLKSAPVVHASTHITGGSDVIADAVYNGASGLQSGADKKTYDDHIANTTSAHGITVADVTEVNADRDSNAIYGFEETGKPTLSYDYSTRTLTITGSHYVWCNGTRYSKSNDSKVHTDTTGIHYFYYDASGVLTTSMTAWDIMSTSPIAYVIYNASKSGIKGVLFDERHGKIMSSATHKHLHTIEGARTLSLFPLADYLLQPSDPTNAGNQFSVGSGNISDEDIYHSLSAWPDGNAMPIFYRTGANGDWTWNESPVVPALVGTSYIQYNQYTGGTWTLTETTNNNLINMWLVATNHYGDGGFRFVLICGQNIYSTLADAQAATFSGGLNLGTFPFHECVPIQQITLRTGSGYTSTGKFRIESVGSLFGTRVAVGSVTTTDHNSLSGRGTFATHPVSSLSIAAGAFATYTGSNVLQTGLDYVAPQIIKPWIANTSYSVGDLVMRSSLIYRCITANTDATFTASKWYCLADVMTGATSGAAGLRGLVPTPVAGDDVKMLHGDATYKFGRQFYNTGDSAMVSMDTAWYEMKKFVWPGSTSAGIPSSFVITIYCSTAAIQYNCQILDLTNSTTVMASGIITSSSTVGYTTTTFTSFSNVPASPALLSIQMSSSSTNKKNVQMVGSVLVIN